MKLTIATQILIATYANFKFASAQESSIADSYKDGCINHIDFAHNFEADDGDGCDGCSMCEGSKLLDVFNPHVPRTCIECIQESKCSSFSLVTSFRNAWQMKFNMLHSSDMAAEYDPKQIVISGSNDSKSWEDLYTTDSNSKIFQGREEAKEFLFPNNSKTYKEYRITFKFADLLKLYIGSYSVVQTYTRQCTSDLYNDMTENTLLPYTTSAPTEVPTSAPTNVALSNAELRTAVALWFKNKNEAEAKYGHISEWNTSLATNMGTLFYAPYRKTDAEKQALYAFNEDLSKWNVSGVTTMSNIFGFCKKFNGDIGGWDVSSVKIMDYVFQGNWAFNQDISKWDVSSATTMGGMIKDCTAFNQNLSNWNVANVTNIFSMFSKTEKFNQDISKWDVSSVKIFDQTFDAPAPSAFNQDLSSWNIAKAQTMNYMFRNNKAFKQQLCWDLPKGAQVNDMFLNSPGSIGCD